MVGNAGFKIKKEEDLKIMLEGGKRLARVKHKLAENVMVSVNAKEIDDLAEKLIIEEGGKSSFKMVPGYSWTTCVNVNDGIVHGIPKEDTVFKKGDLVSVDVGMYYKGFHTDTSFSLGVETETRVNSFLKSGEEALNLAIKKAIVGNRIYDISKAIEDSLTKSNLTPIKVLVGHGIGKELHEDPQIPCYVTDRRENTLEIPSGVALAIEVMYAEGNGDLFLGEDGWTIYASDGKITGLFEDTVIVEKKGTRIITR